MNNFETGEIQSLIKAIILIQSNIKWKPNKAQSHLLKRIKLGHLRKNSSLETYEEIIKKVTLNPESQLYVLQHENSLYPTLTGTIEESLWLVMFGIDGVMETAFPPSNPQKYLSNNSFIYLGKLKDFM